MATILHRIKAYLYDNILTKDTSNVRTMVEESDIVTNNPSEVMVVIPVLAAGTYNLEVVTQYGGSTPLKDGRTATLGKILMVV